MKKCAELPLVNKYLSRWDDLVESVAKNKTAKDFKQIKSLAVFDFDKTLFRSPDAPKGYKGNWHIKIDSLSQPYVEDIAKEHMWIAPIVDIAKSLIPQKDVYCIMLTGRVDKIFEDRIKQLLAQKNLNFDYVWLNEFGGDTVTNKIQTIESLIKKMPRLQTIKMWEDKPDQADKFKEHFSNKSYSFNLFLVDESKLKTAKKSLKIKIKK